MVEFGVQLHSLDKMKAISNLVALQGWIGGITGDPALVILVPRHQYVSIHSPVGAPAAWEEIGANQN